MQVAVYDPSNASAVAGMALIFTIGIWTFISWVIWLFVRKKRKFGVVWFWTNLCVVPLAFVSGVGPDNANYKWALIVILIASVRLFLVVVRLLIKGARKLLANKPGTSAGTRTETPAE